MKHLIRTKKTLFLTLIVTLVVGCDNSSNPKSSVTKKEDAVKIRAIDKQTLEATRKANLWLKVLNNDSSAHIGKKTNVELLKSITKVPKLAKSYIFIADSKNKSTLSIIKNENGSLNDAIIRLFAKAQVIKQENFDAYNELIMKIIKLNPVIADLDIAGKQYADNLIILSRSINKLLDYYKISEEYKLDNFKKTDQLHLELLQAYAVYQAAEDAMNTVYNDFYQRIHNSELKQLETEGYVVSAAMYQGLDASSSIFEQLVTYYNTKNSLKGIEKQSLTVQISYLKSSIQALNKALENPDMVIQEGLTVDNINSYTDSLKQFLVSADVTITELGQEQKQDETLLNNLLIKQKQITDGFNKFIQ